MKNTFIFGIAIFHIINVILCEFSLICSVLFFFLFPSNLCEFISNLFLSSRLSLHISFCYSYICAFLNTDRSRIIRETKQLPFRQLTFAHSWVNFVQWKKGPKFWKLTELGNNGHFVMQIKCDVLWIYHRHKEMAILPGGTSPIQYKYECFVFLHLSLILTKEPSD